ncbi:MAG: ABC transporter substrate-binding protein [Thermodesulfobacteriota bacterium]|nr:ABC transporter substrate-binding protein [Thermodesulfobacteriota bacterium]
MKKGVFVIDCRVLFMVLVSTILVLVWGKPGYCAKGVTDDTITMGVIFDQTGPAAEPCLLPTKAVRNLSRFINKQGGILGRKLKIFVEDDRCAIPMAVSSFKKLVFRDKIISLLGPTSSGGVIALLRSINKEKVPTIPISAMERMVNPFQRYIFTIQDTYPGQMKVIVDYIMKDLKAKNPRIALVLPDNETGKADLKPAMERLKQYNLEPVKKEILNYGSLDATSQVMNLRRAQPDYIISCGSQPQPTIVLLREMRKFGVKIPLFCSWASGSEEVIRITGDASALLYVVHAAASWYDEGPGVAKMREITLKYEPNTEEYQRGKNYTLGWVMVTVMFEGMKRAGRNLNGETLVKSLEGIKNFDTGGLTVPISYSSTSHKGGNAWKIFKADPSTEKFIPKTGWRSPE